MQENETLTHHDPLNFFEKTNNKKTGKLFRSLLFIGKSIQEPFKILLAGFVCSLFLNYSGLLSFSELVPKLDSPLFSGYLLMMYGGVMAYRIILGTFNSSLDGQNINSKFSSIWVPINTALTTSLFLPVLGHDSAFSSLLKSVIHIWIHTFN